MAVEKYQQIRARELGLIEGTGKRYSQQDLESFIEASEENLNRELARNVLLELAIPPILAGALSLVSPDVPVVQGVRGISLAISALEAGWIGGGIIMHPKLTWDLVTRKISPFSTAY